MSPGSSPLSRGIRILGAMLTGLLRIIPALAGNTSWLTARANRYSDHPRSRGEYFEASFKIAGNMGSSPLSRGILNMDKAEIPFRRIIPALAGNTP